MVSRKPEASKTLGDGSREPKECRGAETINAVAWLPLSLFAVITGIWSLGELDWGRRRATRLGGPRELPGVTGYWGAGGTSGRGGETGIREHRP